MLACSWLLIVLDTGSGCRSLYIRECTKILKYKDFSKYPRPLGPPASPPFGDVAGARAGTCRGGEGCGSVGNDD